MIGAVRTADDSGLRCRFEDLIDGWQQEGLWSGLLFESQSGPQPETRNPKPINLNLGFDQALGQGPHSSGREWREGAGRSACLVRNKARRQAGLLDGQSQRCEVGASVVGCTAGQSGWWAQWGHGERTVGCVLQAQVSR
eukprot:3330617-Rhodomonas_salina.2